VEKTRKLSQCLQVMLLIQAFWLPVFCSGALAQGPVSEQKVAEISSSGGLCPTGPCGGRTTVFADGRWESLSEKGIFDRAQVDQLRQEIQSADFAMIKSHPFTGECPEAYDGSSTTYVFYIGDRTEVLSTCKYELPDTVPFTTFRKLLRQTNSH